MSMNDNVDKWLKKKHFTEPIPIKKKLSDIDIDAWPEHPCITCRWWVALSPEMNLGECRTGLPKRGKDPQVPETPIVPPHYFCRQHWARDRYHKKPTHTPEK